MENEALERIDHFLCSWCACRLSSSNEKLGACRASGVQQLILEPRLYSFLTMFRNVWASGNFNATRKI